jgi:hypothetical protein
MFRQQKNKKGNEAQINVRIESKPINESRFFSHDAEKSRKRYEKQLPVVPGGSIAVLLGNVAMLSHAVKRNSRNRTPVKN